MFYLKIALQRQKAGLPLPPTDLPEEVEEDEDIQVVEPRHETGCARTEGYYKIPQAEKLRYLLARNQGKAESNKEGNSSLSVSRLARVNARHLASGLDKHKKATATDTDLLQLNQLRTRKKQLRFARSPIHDWGLYALEHIPAGEMVIEYVGEQIRQQVADKREKAYERQGIGSSYLFRVDDDVVIDATMKGNLGRLINHCCTPNCTAKILSVGNSKKIVIYAKQVINKGDEITYDYHFPIEDEKIVCLCGSSGCRGFLN
ncbi:SET domain-containing protein [Cystobasidium minutum MCA 4210]|uniref:SET domain-containing protein n=1 Tax=Cystobasidium minutum MCA 4210 TaxID=1397322 RepID=UPI0034CEEE59|eukprot:jgi/Rhomi1/146192/e_gw1.6.582.1